MGLALSNYPNIYILDASDEDALISFNMGKDMGEIGIKEYNEQHGIIDIMRGIAFIAIVFEEEQDITNFKLKYEKTTGIGS